MRYAQFAFVMAVAWLVALVMVVVGLSAIPARAGCLGVSVGDPCIGIPTPEDRVVHERPVIVDPPPPPVIVERHHRAPVVIEHYHYDDMQ